MAECCKEMKNAHTTTKVDFDIREKFRSQQIDEFHRMRDVHPDSIKYGAEFEKEWPPDFYFRKSEEFKAWVEGMKEVQRGGGVEAARFKDELIKDLSEKTRKLKQNS